MTDADINGGLEQLAEVAPSPAARVIESIERVNAAVAAHHRRLCELLSVSSSECNAVQFLFVREERGETTRAADVRARLGVSSGATTQVIDRLVAAGRVERTEDPTDRRHRVLSLTATTIDELTRALSTMQADIDRIADTITDVESARITSLLDGVTGVFERTVYADAADSLSR